MREIKFHDFNQQVYELYFAHEYTQALELIEREHTAFPERAHMLAYWRLCFYALLGKQAEALRIFREVLAQGDWFAPLMLEEDSDLVSLRPLPEFQELSEICRQRLAQIKDQGQPELLVAQPEGRATSLPLLLALHGNQGNARDTLEEWRIATAQGWLLGAPTSTQIIGPQEAIWDEREPGINQVQTHLAELSHRYSVDPEHVVLGGYSMGGGLAVLMALQQTIKTRGFVVLAPYLTAEELETLPTLLANLQPSSLRGSILVGEQDVYSLEPSRKIVELMRTHGFSCELEIHPDMDHFYPPSFPTFLSQGLIFVEQG